MDLFTDMCARSNEGEQRTTIADGKTLACFARR